ncbi:MAG: nucleotide-binding protein [Bryobacteraceae bacterium]|nr:nucleotide-binding protein [Bryobacteraceae bacterium]
MRPRIFVGSSKESIEIAYSVQQNLEHDAEITVWNQEIFEPSKYVLDSLLQNLDEFDFGIFVFSGDDIVRIRGSEHLSVRDNVIFEMGLFCGRLGRDRCYILMPRGCEELYLPTDLIGITPALFDANRTDSNLSAAVGPACHQIRKRVQVLGSIKPALSILTSATVEREHDENDAVSILESWMGSRPHEANKRVIPFAETDSLLKLKKGSTEQLIEKAAQKWGYRVLRRGATTIIFQ